MKLETNYAFYSDLVSPNVSHFSFWVGMFTTLVNARLMYYYLCHLILSTLCSSYCYSCFDLESETKKNNLFRVISQYEAELKLLYTFDKHPRWLIGFHKKDSHKALQCQVGGCWYPVILMTLLGVGNQEQHGRWDDASCCFGINIRLLGVWRQRQRPVGESKTMPMIFGGTESRRPWTWSHGVG